MPNVSQTNNEFEEIPNKEDFNILIFLESIKRNKLIITSFT